MIACDFSTKAETMAFLDKFTEEKPYVKIGMELFYAEGPDMDIASALSPGAR